LWSAVARASARLENQAVSHDVFLLFIGGFGSDERLGRFVGGREILLEGGFQFAHAAMHAAPKFASQ